MVYVRLGQDEGCHWALKMGFFRLFWSAPQAKIFLLIHFYNCLKIVRLTSIFLQVPGSSRPGTCLLAPGGRTESRLKVYVSLGQDQGFHCALKNANFSSILERAASEDFFLQIHFYNCIFPPFWKRGAGEDFLQIHFYNCLKIVKLWCRLG